tara:strand:- start:630 stop:875 length:246 start_codon:yes stop_codon:yes gene_type:complete
MSRSPSPTLCFPDEETFPNAGKKTEIAMLKQKNARLIKEIARLEKENAQVTQARAAKAEANKKIEAISTRTSRYLGQPSLF